jgi:hypothetical protein
MVSHIDQIPNKGSSIIPKCSTGFWLSHAYTVISTNEGGYMKVPRTVKQVGKKVDRKLAGVKRKVLKKRAVVAAKPRRVARTLDKRALQGAKSLKRKTKGAKRTTPSKAREAGKAVGTFLGKAIGTAERIVDKAAETAKDILN